MAASRTKRWALGLLGACGAVVALLVVMKPGGATLRGTIETRRQGCTKEACGIGDPCCNTCWGEPVLVSEGQAIVLEELGVPCRGTSCGVTCEGIEPKATYQVRGRFRTGPEGARVLQVKSYAKVP